MIEDEWLKQHRFDLFFKFREMGVKRFRSVTPELLKKATSLLDEDNFNQYSPENVIVNETDVLLPGKNNKSCFVVLHSGGFVTGSGKTCIQFQRYLNERFDFDVYAPNYPLYPEVLAPGQIRFLNNYLNEDKFKNKEIYLVGVSAGANLALSAWNTFLERTKKKVKGIFLITGHYQNDFETESYNKFSSGEKGGLSKDMTLFLLSHAVGDKLRLKDMNPLLFPYFSKYTDLPYIQIFGALNDVLRDDSRLLAKKISKASFIENEHGFHAYSNAILEVPRIKDFFDLNFKLDHQ